jgi:acyl-CoA synthetase (AMP-forming)/AMP-acid ligase II
LTAHLKISADDNIAEPEAEAALQSHPGVLERTIVALSDADRGQMGEAHLVLAMVVGSLEI